MNGNDKDVQTRFAALEERTSVLEYTVMRLESKLAEMSSVAPNHVQSTREVINSLLRENEALQMRIKSLTDRSPSPPSLASATPLYPRFQSTSVRSQSPATSPPRRLTDMMEQEGAMSKLDVEYPEGYDPMARRYSISSESFSPGAFQDALPTHPPKTKEENVAIRKAITHNVIFKNLDAEQLTEVVNAMKREVVAPGKSVVVEGSFQDENEMYVIESGLVDVYYGDQVVAQLKDGDAFGEIALMYNSPRTATVKTVKESILWVLDRVTFRRVLMREGLRRSELYQSFLLDVPILQGLYPYERAKIADSLEPVYFKAGETVITQGDENADLFYIVELGEAVATKVDDEGAGEEKLSLKYGPGSYFGELSLLFNSPRAASVTAVTDLKCVTISRDHFSQVLAPIQEILERNTGNYRSYQELEKKHQQGVTLKSISDSICQTLVHLQGYNKALAENVVTFGLDAEMVSSIFSFLPTLATLHQRLNQELIEGRKESVHTIEELVLQHADYTQLLESRQSCAKSIYEQEMAGPFLLGCDKLTSDSLVSHLATASTFVPRAIACLKGQSVLSPQEKDILLALQGDSGTAVDGDEKGEREERTETAEDKD